MSDIEEEDQGQADANLMQVIGCDGTLRKFKPFGRSGDSDNTAVANDEAGKKAMDERPEHVPLFQQIAEVKRELRVRESFYPKCVAQRRLDQGDAQTRLARLRAVLETLQKVQADVEPAFL